MWFCYQLRILVGLGELTALLSKVCRQQGAYTTFSDLVANLLDWLSLLFKTCYRVEASLLVFAWSCLNKTYTPGRYS